MIDKSQLLGCWQLESWIVGYPDREDFSQPFGDDPQGMLLYTADDWMSVSVAVREREPLPTDVSFRRIPAQALADAYLSYFHYAGRYRVVSGDILHYVTQSLNPNFVGTEQRRRAELDGHTLALTGVDRSNGQERFHTLVWHKLAAAPAG